MIFYSLQSSNVTLVYIMGHTISGSVFILSRLITLSQSIIITAYISGKGRTCIHSPLSTGSIPPVAEPVALLTRYMIGLVISPRHPHCPSGMFF